MFFEIATLLLLVSLILSSILLARYIITNMKKDREINRFRDDKLFQLVKRTEAAAELVVNTERLIGAYQLDLDKQLTSLEKVVNDENVSIDLHLQKIEALVKLDITSARRNELTRTKELKYALERIMTSATLSRQQPAGQDIMAVDVITNRIEELENILADQSN